jgi:hypothetical protein
MRSDAVHKPLGSAQLVEGFGRDQRTIREHAAHTQIILFLTSVRQRGGWSGIAIQVFHRNLPCATSQRSALKVQRQSNLLVLTRLVKANFRFFHNPVDTFSPFDLARIHGSLGYPIGVTA